MASPHLNNLLNVYRVRFPEEKIQVTKTIKFLKNDEQMRKNIEEIKSIILND